MVIPDRGYILPLWDSYGNYRATAIAYMQREKIDFVEHANGETYSFAQLEGATIK